MSTPYLSVVVPAFNEEESLPELVAEIRAAVAQTGLDWELLLVDDGSTDRSCELMRELREADSSIRVLRLPRNAGQSAALALGLLSVRGEIVVTLDADLQNDPQDIPRLLAELERGFDVVSGVRVDRRDHWIRRISSKIANGLRNYATDESISDVGCSLKAYRTEFLRHVPMFVGMHRFLPTLARWNGARVTELPVNHRPRRHGAGNYGIGNRIFRVIADLFAVRWMRTRWIDPRNREELD